LALERHLSGHIAALAMLYSETKKEMAYVIDEMLVNTYTTYY
jgi:hypothetical protein